MATSNRSSKTVETLAGLAAGFTTTALTHPLDFFKLRLQLDTTSGSQSQAISKIYHGLLISSRSSKTGKVSIPTFLHHLYRGIGPNLVGSASAWAMYFLCYRHYKNLVLYTFDLNHDRHLKSWHYLTAAFLAGWTTSILTNPIWVIKTRMISTERSAPGAYSSIIDGIKSIYQKEGVIGYYRGLLPALLNVAQGAVQLSLYDIIKRNLINQHNDETNEQLTTFQYFYASSLSKMVSTIMFYPLQVIRSRLQVISTSNKLKSATSMALQMFHNEGIRCFYKGLSANLLRVIPATCTTFLVYEKAKQIL